MEIFPDGLDGDFLSLTMLAYPFVSQTFVVYYAMNTSECTAFMTDHSLNTANTVLHASSNDLLLEGNHNFTVQF